MGLDQAIDANTFDNRHAADSKLFVVFLMKAQKHGFKSEQEGRPIFEDVPYCRIHVPGDKTTVIEEPVTEEHKARFPRQWEQFAKGLTQAAEGTPLEEWPQLSVSQVHEFKAMNVMSVEHLAGMADTFAMRFMGGMELRRRAQAYLALAKDTALAQKLVVQNDELQARLAAQDQFILKMAARLEVLETMQRAKQVT